MALRLIPNLTLIRPGDENEVIAAWVVALMIEDGPVALCFTRQPVESTVSDLTAERARAGLRCGAYVLYGEPNVYVDVEIFTTGSEIHPSVEAARELEREGLRVRVIAVPSWELFEKQEDNYKKMILSNNADLKVSVEAGIGLGWQRFVGSDGLIIAMDSFGASASAPVMQKHFGFTAENIVAKIKNSLPSEGVAD
jgi:transketolase